MSTMYAWNEIYEGGGCRVTLRLGIAWGPSVINDGQ